MKLKLSVAMAAEKAANGTPLNENDRKVLRALSEWIQQGSPERKKDDPGTWSNDDTLTYMPPPQVSDLDKPPWPEHRSTACSA